MINTTKRTGEQLKKCWNNIKFKSRQQKMAERKETMATGGGPSRKDDEEDNYLRKVESVVPHLNLRVNSVFDSDGFIGEENRDIDVLYDEIVEVDLQHSETENETTLEKVKVDNGETPKKKLKKEVNPRASVNTFLERRKELDEKHQTELHNLKIQHEVEFHAAKMKHQEEIHRLTIKHMEELHQVQKNI
ncbi:hypothetical protein C0J52_24024 [Blattella germanica]|nr:hypothetical protein C0J52_24024 [Blattella germanica]